MNKEALDEFCREESTEWSFPNLELFVRADYEDDPINNDRSVKSEIDQNIILTNSIVETESLKNIYHKKIESINALISRLQNPIRQLDNELIDMIENVIKLAVKKIIYKEIDSDLKKIKKIIGELITILDSNNGMFTVMLSEADYSQLINDYDNSKMTLKMNPALNKGDVVIKSNLTEIHAVLNERISHVLGSQNV